MDQESGYCDFGDFVYEQYPYRYLSEPVYSLEEAELGGPAAAMSQDRPLTSAEEAALADNAPAWEFGGVSRPLAKTMRVAFLQYDAAGQPVRRYLLVGYELP